MKMPLGWAKEFAKIDCTPHEYAERMTMSGSKVETYESEADSIENVVVGKILSLVPHPDSDHMVVCQVDVGAQEPVQIVTGAGNPQRRRLSARRFAQKPAARRKRNP